MIEDEGKAYNLEEFEDRIVLQLERKLPADEANLLKEDLLSKISGEHKPKVMLVGVTSFGSIPSIAMLEAQKHGMSTMIVCHPEAVKGDLSQLSLPENRQMLISQEVMEHLSLAEKNVDFDYVMKKDKKIKPYVPKKTGVVNNRLKGRNSTSRR